jgi:hypothetical protein
MADAQYLDLMTPAAVAFIALVVLAYGAMALHRFLTRAREGE